MDVKMMILGIILYLTATEALYLRKDGRRYNSATPTMSTLMSGEPTCEDLRVMWRFSRRQSRMAEITNEIPTYRDPFAYNVWEEYPRPRDMVGTLRSGGRSWNRPVYGKLIDKAPKNHPRIGSEQEARAYEQVLRYMSKVNGGASEPRRPPASAFRLTGSLPRPDSFTQSGSFQHLKQIIWAERAKELQEQRLLEEAGAKALAMKNLKPRGFGKQSVPARSLYLPANHNANLRLASQDAKLYNQYFSQPIARDAYDFQSAQGAQW